MVLYQCHRCSKNFKQKSDFERHWNRKFKCKEKEYANTEQFEGNDIPPIFQNGINQVKNRQTEQNGSVFSPIFHQTEHFGTPDQQKNDQFKIQNLKKNQFNSENLKDFLVKKSSDDAKNSECPYCKKEYSSKFNLNKHLKKCKVKELNPNLVNSVSEPQKNSVQPAIFIDNSKMQTINTINNTNQTIININAFGNEDLSYLTDAKLKYLMAQVLPKDVIPKMIKDTHCNPEQPQNMNIYKPNKRDNMLMKFDGEKWLMELSKPSINKMIESNLNLLDNKLAELGLTENEIRKIQNIHQNAVNEEQRKAMMEQVICDLYNNRDKIERAKLQEAFDDESDDAEDL
jgi:hypothetical protein